MKREFRKTVKARGGEGAFTIWAGSAVCFVCLGVIVLSLCRILTLDTTRFTLACVVLICASFILHRSVSDFSRSSEWELFVDGDFIRWIDRDSAMQNVVGEVSIRDIRALIYHGGGDSDPFLEIEFTDSSVQQLPSRGILVGATLREFIYYWTDVHGDIPIRNIDPA